MIRRGTGLLVLTIAGIIFTVLQSWLIKEPEEFNITDIKQPIILWWKKYGTDGQKTCGKFQCYFSANRELQSNPFFKAIIFYGSYLSFDDLPIPRPRHIQWGLLHEESPRNNPAIVNEEFLNLFNYSSTFSRYSDVPILQIPGIEELTTTKFFVPFEKKDLLISQDDFAPLLYLQSNCDSVNDRDAYVSELMKYIRVDAYGDCLNNRKMPEALKHDHLEALFDEEFYEFAARYKFTLAFENADCEDYITEKLWRPLIVGSVPIYYGSPTFKDWLPNEKSAISVRDFGSPKELAEFIEKLSKNQSIYDEYLAHKLVDRSLSIKNERLLSLYAKKPLGITFEESLNEFECHICKAVSTANLSKKSVVTQSHFSCQNPTSALTRKINPKNPWVDFWKVSKCEAKLIAHHVTNNIIINKTVFEEERSKMYLNKEC